MHRQGCERACDEPFMAPAALVALGTSSNAPLLLASAPPPCCSFDAGSGTGKGFRVEEAVQAVRAHNAAAHGGAGGAATDGGAAAGAAGNAPPVTDAVGP